MQKYFPAAYRHFVNNGLLQLEPWTLADDAGSIDHQPDFEKNRYATRQCKRETGAGFDFYLFARRHDRDDFAFFIVKNGVIEDKVLTIHLSFVDKLELAHALRYENVTQTFLDWVSEVAIPDMKDCIDD